MSMSALPHPIRLVRCCHGTYFLTIDRTTVSVTEEELVNIARAIYGLAEKHRPLFVAMIAGIRAEQLKNQQNGSDPVIHN